jgi:hypothetical protein
VWWSAAEHGYFCSEHSGRGGAVTAGRHAASGRPARRAQTARRQGWGAAANRFGRTTPVPTLTQRQLASGLHAAWQRQWRKPTRWQVAADDADWAALRGAATAGPALWEDDGELRLYIGDSTFQVHAESAGSDRLVARRGGTPAIERMLW